MQQQNSFCKLLIALASTLFISCNGDQKENNGTEKKRALQQHNQFAPGEDSLPDTPQFVFALDEKQFTVQAANVSADYVPDDSLINIYVKAGDIWGLIIAVPYSTDPPFSVSTGFSSEKTKIAFSEERAIVPTIIMNNYPVDDISFNNLYDGFHKQEPQPGAMTITSFRQVESKPGSLEKNYLLKGYIHTRLYKNVYATKAKENNRDYELNGKFVIAFSSYW